MNFPKTCREWLGGWVCLGSFALAAMSTSDIRGAEASGAAETAVVRSADASAAAERLHWLRAEIARHDELYFKKATPEITDAEYDRLKREMLALENALPADVRALAAGPSRLGDDRNGRFPGYRHREPMLGLAKAYTEAELRAFHARLERETGRTDLVFVVEPKFDGIAISVTYEHGRLVRAVTRGNGREGDDVTANVRTISGLPRTLSETAPDGARNHIPDTVELRGEIYLDYEEFARINAERAAAGDEPFAHPRNLAAGTLKQKDPADVAERALSVVFYGLGAWQGEGAAPESQQALHALVRAWGLPGVKTWAVTTGVEDTWTAITRLGDQRSSLAFPTDGVVVKLDDAAWRRRLGATAEAPLWAIAYKFPPERTTTRLRAITLQVGRTGMITPVAELEPVKIGGTLISRATLHNADEIARRDLRIGDTVYVEKAGEIIPALTGVDLSRRAADAKAFVFPAECPACGASLIREPDEAATRCPNRRCVAQVRRRIEHFTAPTGVGIDGFGPALIETLVNAKAIGGIADLYRLRRDDLMAAGNLSASRAGRLLAEIERSKRAGLATFVGALGLPGIGRRTAETLAARHGGLAALAEGADDRLDEAGRALIAELIELGVNPRPTEAANTSGPLAGKTLVLTGTLPVWSRAEAGRRIVQAGGRVTRSVSGRTDWVVAGEGAGAKLAKARELGVTVIGEAELRSLLGESPAAK